MSKPELEPMSEDLRRQRRNLMAISFLIWFLKFCGIKIVKISVLGAQAEIGNPEGIIIAIWIIWFYFLIRYYQYYRHEGLKSLRQAWIISHEGPYNKKLNDLVKEKYSEIDSQRLNLKYTNLEKDGLFKKKYFARESSAFQGKNIEFSINEWKLWNEKLKTVLDFIRNRTQFMDYLLPFIISLTVLIYSTCIKIINIVKF